eukprot:gene10025-18655_t
MAFEYISGLNAPAKVMHSQRINEEFLRPWVAASDDGTILCAHCNCMARLGESCSHIGALLFKVEAAVRLGYTSLACASKPLDEQKDFLQRLYNLEPKEQPVALSIFENFSTTFHHKANVRERSILPKSPRSFFTEDELKYEEKRAELYAQKLSKADIHYIESATRSQSKSLVWHEIRVGRITASLAHDVLHSKIDKPAKSLVLKICGKSKPLNVPSVLWGQESESKALKKYQEQLKTLHTNVMVSRCGLMLDQEHTFLGASADAIGHCDCHGDFLIEVKCPYTHRDKTNITQCLGDKKFCLDNDLELKSSHRYYTQVQMQMQIYGYKVCHFVVWGPHFCKGLTIPYKEDLKNSMKFLIEYHKKVVSHELVSRKLEKSETFMEGQQELEKEVFCYCQQPESDESMIGYDNPQCKFKWIHFKCIKPNLKRPPKGAWYCKDCKKKK